MFSTRVTRNEPVRCLLNQSAATATTLAGIGRGRDHHRTAEMPSLSELHAQAEQGLELILGLDAFGDDPSVDMRPEREQ